jgi:hypothetical protein
MPQDPTQDPTQEETLYRNWGADSQIGGHRVSIFGQRVSMPKALADEAILGGAHFLSEEDFQSLSIPDDMLDKYPNRAEHEYYDPDTRKIQPIADEEFLSRRRKGDEIIADRRAQLEADDLEKLIAADEKRKAERSNEPLPALPSVIPPARIGLGSVVSVRPVVAQQGVPQQPIPEETQAPRTTVSSLPSPPIPSVSPTPTPTGDAGLSNLPNLPNSPSTPGGNS